MPVVFLERGYKILFLNALLFYAALLARPGFAFEVPGPLVETDWLQDHLQDVVVLDVREAEPTDTNSIAGARRLPWKSVRADRQENGETLLKMLPSKAAFETLMRSLGVNKDSAIVITSEAEDVSTTFTGTRLYWQLKYFGHDNVALLNGGNAKWFQEQRPISASVTRPAPGNFVAGEERRSILATTRDVEEALQDNSVTLLDTRPLVQYLGLYKKSYVYAPGHIPGAKSADSAALLSPGRIKMLLDVEGLTEVLKERGIDPHARSIVYCNSGHLASGSWFVEHELLGNPDVRLYDGSMHAWTKDSRRPLVRMKIE